MRIVILTIAMLWSTGCGYSQKAAPVEVEPCPYLSADDAGKILGGSAAQIEGKSEIKVEVRVVRCGFVLTDNPDSKMFLILETPTEMQGDAYAMQTYRSTRESNGRLEGVEDITGIGDEAYFHTDNANFALIMARKGGMLLRMKINKLTKGTSREELIAVVKEITRNSSVKLLSIPTPKMEMAGTD